MSGTTRGIGVRSRNVASEFWFNASAAVGCGDATTPPQQVYGCMMEAPAQAIIRSLVNTVDSPVSMPYSPTIDDKVVFGSDSNRSAARVPMLIGNTDNEVGLFRVFVDQPDSDDFWHEQNQVTFNCPVAARALASVRDGSPTWRYRWHGVFPNTILSTRPPSGAYHDSEVAVLFGNADQSEVCNTREEDAIGRYMRGAFAAFAKDPVRGLLGYRGGWPRYVPDRKTLVRIGYENRTGANLAVGTLYDGDC
jgi:carboxylesterase type B